MKKKYSLHFANCISSSSCPFLFTASYAIAAAAAKSLQSCPTLCNPTDGSPPGSSVPGILQVRILEWVAISFSNACMHAKLLQSCPTLCNPMDNSPPGSAVNRILQARILEWVAISLSTYTISKHLLGTSYWPALLQESGRLCWAKKKKTDKISGFRAFTVQWGEAERN